MIDFKCPGCAKSFSVKDELAGRKTKCPKCGAPMLVPGTKGPAAAARVPAPVNSPSPASSKPTDPPPTAAGNTPVKENAQKPRRALSTKSLVIGGGALLGFFMLCCGGVALLMFGSGGGGGSKIAGVLGVKSKALEVTAREINEAYAANAIAADEKYKGKTVQTEGVLQKIMTDDHGKPHLFVHGDFEFYFDDNHKGEVAKLSKGQIIAVRGILDGRTVLKKCELVEAKPVNLELTVSALLKEWRDDPNLSMARYTGKTLQITGKVFPFRDPFTGKVGAYIKSPEQGRESALMLDVGDKDEGFVCFFDSIPKEKLEKLSIGKMVTVRGNCDFNNRFHLKKCDLVK